MKCSRCQHENPAGTRFCGQCAAGLASLCGACGARNPPDNRFCGQVRSRYSLQPLPVSPLPRPTPSAPRREDPHLEGRPRRRAEAGHRAVRRPQGFDGTPGRPRPRRGAAAARSRPRADDGGRPPLRGHGQPGDGRRHHGAVRRAGRPRGSRGAGLLRGPPDAGRRAALLGGAASRAGHRGSDRVGLHSGDVVVRSIGSDLRMDYSAVGRPRTWRPAWSSSRRPAASGSPPTRCT